MPYQKHVTNARSMHAILSGPTASGSYEQVKITDHGKLEVKNGNVDAYGNAIVNQIQPITQIYNPYGTINTQLFETITNGGGSISSSNNGIETDISISTGVGDYAVLRSKRVVKYRPGYSNAVKFNAIFDTPVASSLQFGGIGNNGNDLYFCYNGTSFGVRKSTDGYSEIRTLTITAAATVVETGTVTLNGTAYNVSLTNAGGVISFTAHEIEVGNAFSGWFVEHIGTTIVFMSRDVGAKSGTYSFTSTGTAAGTFAQDRAGTSLSTTFISQANWNGSSAMARRVNPLLRNMYEIEYSWYGSGNVLYKILNPDTGVYEVVHTLTFANQQTEPSLIQPNMYVQLGVASLGSTTALSMSAAGMFAGTYGKWLVTEPIHSISNEKAIASSTETVLLVIKNRYSMNGFANLSEIFIDRLSLAADGNRAVRIRLIKNPTAVSASSTGDYTDYQEIDGDDSLGLYDTTAITYTGGDIIDEVYLGKDGNLYLDYSLKRISFTQGDILVVSAFSTAVNTTSVALTLLDDL